MSRNVKYWTSALLFIGLSYSLAGQVSDTIILKGQLSGWGNFNYTNEAIYSGGRYIPQLNYSRFLKNDRLFDVELSVNTYGSTTGLFNDSEWDIKPYRAWVRYSSPQLEVRAGLQKINFGSATMLRPLMWFDGMDPRDPLQLTDGVWGLLGRYYFLSNANIWLWGLYGNRNTKGWEFAPTNSRYPEFGGRVQVPVPLGDVAISYHHRVADLSDFGLVLPDIAFAESPENRLGFDARFDWVVGFWVEGTWVKSNLNLLTYTSQTILNAGVDYTFGVGQGLYVVYEQLMASFDQNSFEFSEPINFSLLSLSYPIGLFDNVGAMLYYSWEEGSTFNFIRWQRTYNKLSIHLMGYWNPETFSLPQQSIQSSMFGGRGVQVMLVYSH